MKGRARAILIAALLGAVAPAVAQAPASTEWDKKQVPIEVFAQFPMINRPRMTPDGSWIAAKIRAGGQQVLALLPVEPGGGDVQIIARDGDFSTDKIGTREITSFRWLDDEVLLIGLRSRDNFEGQWFDNLRYASYNRKTRKVLPLGWDNAFAGTDLVWASNEGTPRILLARANPENGTERLSKPEVVEVNAITGATRIVMGANPMVSDWTADAGGVVRMGSTYNADTGKASVMYRPDAKTGMRTVYEGIPDRYNGTPLPDVLLKSPDKAYSLSAREGVVALYSYDLTKMAPDKKLFGIEGYDLDGPILSYDGTTLEGVRYTSDREHTKWFDPRMKEIQAILEETFGKGNVQIETSDAKREKLLFSVAAPGQAPAVYYFNTQTGATRRIAFYNETLKDAKLNPVSMVRYPASDGKQIDAVLTLPRHHAGEKKRPVIVLAHGGPWARDSADWDAYGWAQALAELGYVVIQPNFRGSTGYGPAWTKAAEGAWGLRMQDDLNDAVDWLAAQGIADPGRACVMGWSYGGYAASRAAQRDGKRYRCAISGAGVHDLPSMVAYDKNYLGLYAAKRALGSAGQLEQVSPGLHPADFSAPILIVHGARDQRVPVAQSRGLVSRLKAAGKVEGRDFVYVEQPLNTHNLLREEDRVQFLQEVKKFLDRFNPA